MMSQPPKFEIVTNGHVIDISDPMIEIVELVEIIEAMIPATKMRLIMTLLQRTDDFNEFLMK